MINIQTKLVKIMVVVNLMFFAMVHVAVAQSSFWPVIDNNHDSYIDFTLKSDSSLIGESIVFENTGAKISPNIASINYVRTLLEYYKLARKNNPNAVVPLYYSGDGALERYKKDINNIPDMFSEFHKLKKVELGNVYYWGDYIAISLNQFGDNNKLITPWMELMNCNPNCLLSDRLFHLDEKFSFFSTLLPYVRKEPISMANERLTNEWAALLFEDNITKNPISVRHRLSLLQKHKPLIAESQNKENGLEKFTAVFLTWFKELFEAEAEDADKDVNVAIKKIKSFISSVWEQGIAGDFERGIDNEMLKKVSVKAGLIFTDNWGEDYENKLIKSYSFEASTAEVEKKSQKVLMKNYRGVKNYTNVSFSHMVSKWKEVQPFAYAKDGKVVYVWLKANNINGLGGYYLFAYDTAKGQLASPQTKSWSLMMSNLFSKTTIKYLLSLEGKPNDI